MTALAGVGLHFSTEKARVLSKVDLSRKGSVDEPIAELVSYVNSLKEFYTTSSCSGRLVVLQEDDDQRKKGCHWWLMSHDQISHQQLGSSLSDVVRSGVKRYAYFKFEPFILHVIARTLDNAQIMMQAAANSGFRNSGISCGKKGKIMVAVRSTQCLEVPLVHDGNILVGSEYLQHLVELGNSKMQDNLHRIDRFFRLLKKLVTEKRQLDSIAPAPSRSESGNAKSTPGHVQRVDTKAESDRTRVSREKTERDQGDDSYIDNGLDLGKLFN